MQTFRINNFSVKNNYVNKKEHQYFPTIYIDLSK